MRSSPSWRFADATALELASCSQGDVTVLYRITLNLARGKQNPEGSTRYGYEILAPLDSTGHLDPEAWKDLRDHCRVRRFRAGEPDRDGRLVHRPGGAGGATWLIDYDDRATDDDEAGFRLGAHIFAPGEYVSIRDEDGDLHTFAVAHVQAVTVKRASERA